jgi:hypothetical protein
MDGAIAPRVRISDYQLGSIWRPLEAIWNGRGLIERPYGAVIHVDDVNMAYTFPTGGNK